MAIQKIIFRSVIKILLETFLITIVKNGLRAPFRKNMKRNTKNEKNILQETEIMENEPSELGILDYSFTLKDILIFLIPVSVLGGISYYLYVANKKLTFKINKLEAQVTNLVQHYQQNSSVISAIALQKRSKFSCLIDIPAAIACPPNLTIKPGCRASSLANKSLM